jgi:hypothetical protein
MVLLRTCHVLRHPAGVVVDHRLLPVVTMVAVTERCAACEAEDDEAKRAHSYTGRSDESGCG